MASESYVDLRVGNGQPADTVRFRAGSCSVLVVVGDMELRATDIDIGNGINQLPLCTLSLPLGTPVGGEAAKDPAANSIARLRVAFQKFAPVTVKVTVVDLEATADLGNAFKSGEHTVFSGFVSSTRIAATGGSSVSFIVRLAHDLVAISSGVPLFSGVVSGDGFGDYDTVITGFNAPVDVSPSTQPWETFKAIAKDYIGKTIEVREKRWVQKMKYTERIKAATKRSTDLLSNIVSVADLKYSGSSASTTQARIRDHLKTIILETQRNSNLLASTIRVGQLLYCGVMFTRTKGYFIPFDPLWKRGDMKIIRAGMCFSQSYLRQSGSEIRQGYDITGTICVVAMAPSFYAFSKLNTPAAYHSWMIPQQFMGSQHELIDEVEFPSWIDSVTPKTLTKGGVDGTDKVDDKKPGVHHHPKDFVAAEDVSAKQATIVAIEKISEDFAFFNTMVKNLGSNSLEVTMALRDDIVPGICLGVDMRTPDGAQYTVYGQVEHVETLISVSRLTASTVVRLRYVRGEIEQDIIDGEDREHFAWKRDAKTLNELRLWQ